MTDEPEKHEETLRSLIETVVNGEASDEQRQQLEHRLLNDEQARDAWLNYVNLHASLNRWFLASSSAQPVDNNVVDTTTILSRETSRPKGYRSYRPWITISTVALLLVVSVYFLLQPSVRETPIVDAPKIVKLAGDIRIRLPDGSTVEATSRDTIRPGEQVISNSDEDRVVLRYGDGTEIVLLGSSSLTVSNASGSGKQLHLKTGLLRADVAPQPSDSPLVIATPQTQVRVLGTRFDLSTDEISGTRLDLESGQVELVRGQESPVKVEPQFIAIIPTTSAPISVSPRPAVVDTPQRETVFRGLKSVAFAEDGKTLIAGTRWQALYWYEDDRLEVIPLSKHGRNGINLLQQSCSQLIYFERHEKKIKIFDAQTRKSRTIFENILDLRGQFRKSPDRPETWNPVAKLEVVSPTADWLGFQVGRELRVWRAEPPHWPNFARDYDGRFIGALSSSPSGDTLAVAVRRGHVDLIDVKTGEITTNWSLKHEVPFAMDFSTNGQFLAVGLAGHVAVHDVTTGDVVADFKQPGLPFLKVAISADGRFLAASSLGERVWMWDVTNGDELPLLDIGEPIHDLTFSPKGDRLAIVSRGGQLTVWNVAAKNPEL